MVGVQKRKIQWAISVFLVMLYFSGLSAQAQYGGGTGEPNDPYLIYTAEHMNAIGTGANDWDKHFKLMADIDLAAYTGDAFNIIGYWVDLGFPDNKPFTGVFDGNGKKISSFTYTSRDANEIGLFGYVSGKNAVIKDLGLINPNIDVDAGTGDRVGSLVGYLARGTITNCYVEGGSVSGDEYAGGLLGWNGGRISNCYAVGSVTGSLGVGGLVGTNETGTISNSYSTGSVTGWGGVGGLAGENYGTITDCCATGNVSGDLHVGGLVGWNADPITNCYSAGSVVGNSTVGGLVGYNDWSITNCYSVGPVMGTTDVGGLVGWNAGTITNCYSAGSVVGNIFVGGLVGNTMAMGGAVTDSFWDIQTSGQTNSDGGTGLITTEMKTASTFIIWGKCGNAGNWTIDEGNDYPRLWWEQSNGEPISGEATLAELLMGEGTRDNPYLIYTAEQLNLLNLFPCDWDKQFKLMADIDLDPNLPDGRVFDRAVIPEFSGTFDGNGHTISHLMIEGESSLGLFRRLDHGGEIKELAVVDVNTIGSGRSVGGLVGFNEGSVSNCYSTGTVTGNDHVGGLVGTNSGGLWGVNTGTITTSYSTSTVSGGTRVGGLVGGNGGSISESYSTGRVSGTGGSVGGLVGRIWFGWSGVVKTTTSFWDMETSGLVSSDGGTGKTTAEMQTASTFLDAGWDFVDETENGTKDIWWILEGQDYPKLWWEEVSELEN